MKYRFGAAFLAASLAVAVLFGLAKPAAAQIPFNCAMLSGSPFLCLKNESGKLLVAIQTVAPNSGWYNPASWVTIPGGGVQPGGAAVVKFPAYKGCIQNIVVRTD